MAETTRKTRGKKVDETVVAGAETPVTVTGKSEEQTKPVEQKPEPKAAGDVLIKVMNVTPYPKVNPTNSHVYHPNVVIKDVKKDNWVEVQLAAGILKVVE